MCARFNTSESVPPSPAIRSGLNFYCLHSDPLKLVYNTSINSRLCNKIIATHTSVSRRSLLQCVVNEICQIIM